MLMITLVASLCNTMPGPELCLEEIVTDSSRAPMSMQDCQVFGQMGIIQWMQAGKYRDNWRLAGYKCVPGHYEIRGRV
jgi:hypothetical protein